MAALSRWAMLETRKRMRVMTDIHPSLLKRKIIHVDMDAFYAAIEVRDDPTLKGKPVVVGGSPNSRAVVCTANYEARRFGIHSAMSCSRAYRLCPTVIFLPPNFAKYYDVSFQIREIFRRYTSLIEPLSLDEAFLDVTQNDRQLFATEIAKRIQRDIFSELRLTASAGVAPNKLLAKIASEMKKPAGLTVIRPAGVIPFMRELPLRKIHGVGPATEKRLAVEGFRVCADLWSHRVEALRTQLGNMADWLAPRSRGIDDRAVEPGRVRKSLGKEETFPVDILDISQLDIELDRLAIAVSRQLVDRRLKGRTITVKLKYADFSQCTRSHTRSTAVDDAATLCDIVRQLLRRTEAGSRTVRLIGLSISNFGDRFE